MKIFKIHIYSLAFVLCFFIALALAGENICIVYPVPVSELKASVTKWLEERNFSIWEEPLGPGQTELKAVLGKKEIILMLEPDSPLGSKLKAEKTKENEKIMDSLLTGIKQSKNSGRSYYKTRRKKTRQKVFVPDRILSMVDSVVCVKARSKEGEIQFSGFIVDKNGLVLCTAHDLSHIRKMDVILHDGRVLKGKIVKKNAGLDLVLLDINLKTNKFISLKKSRKIMKPGESLYTIGCPENLMGTVFAGFASGLPRKVNGLVLWQVNMEILHGSSGSPVFDKNGRLVGVVKGRLRGTDNIGFVIPMDTVMAFITRG